MTKKTDKERNRSADRVRAWRERNAYRPDSRRVDRVLVEALVEYLRIRPDGDGSFERILDDAVAGLGFQGYDEETARREVGKRLHYLMIGGGTETGSVRAALDEKRTP